MKSFVNFLWTGFGTDTTAGRAVGIAILIILGVFILAYYLISWIVRMVKKNSPDQPAA